MNRIEELKAQAKKLEFNKRQMEKQLEEITQKIEELKNYRYYLNAYGGITTVPKFFDEKSVKRMKQQGNYFETVEEAEKESKKRDLMGAIEEFRNECNEGWKPNWANPVEGKFYISIKGSILSAKENQTLNILPMFGYFKNQSDCEKAIELFGDRILTLYVD